MCAEGADAAACSFGFSSEYRDNESGLVYYNYRYLNPELGRWMTRDPIKEVGGDNLYSLLSNNILNRSDQRGLIDFDVLGIISALVRPIVNLYTNFTATTTWLPDVGPSSCDTANGYYKILDKTTTETIQRRANIGGYLVGTGIGTNQSTAWLTLEKRIQHYYKCVCCSSGSFVTLGVTRTYTPENIFKTTTETENYWEGRIQLTVVVEWQSYTETLTPNTQCAN